MGLLSSQSLTPLPINKLGPSGADSWVGGFLYFPGPCGSLQLTLQGWGLLPLQSPQVLSVRGFEALFPCARTLGCSVCLAPQLLLAVYLLVNVDRLLGQLLPGLPRRCCVFSAPWLLFSTPLLPIWMNVSLTPWLSDFHTVRFSGSSGYFLFLNLLYFWLCEEAKCVYQCLHLGGKSLIAISLHPGPYV